MYCNLSKTQAIPVAVRVSSHSSGCLNPLHSSKLQSFSSGFSSKLPKSQSAVCFRSFSCGCTRKTLKISYLLNPINLSVELHCLASLRCEIQAKPTNFSSGIWIGSSLVHYCARSGPSGRNFSSVSRNIVEDNGKSLDSLPWLASQSIKETKRMGKEANPKNIRSSWEESAKKFLKGGSSAVESSGNKTKESHRNNFGDMKEVVEDEKDEGEIEVSDDPRWDKIKNRVNRFVDTRPRSDKPEFRKWSKEENWGKKTWKEATETTVPKMVGEGVYGVGPVLAALSAKRREFYALYIQEGLDLSSNNRKKKDKKGFEKVLRIAEKIGLIKKDVSKHDLNMVVDNRPHQGLVLDASPLEMVGIKELDPIPVGSEKAPLWVALDEVTDPQNLGAIIRSTFFFGAAGVVLCAKNSAPLSGVVSKASAGSLELMELRSCKNMMQFLVSSAEKGWRVIGGSVSSKAILINEIEPNLPTILVLGSEGTGLRPLVERSCTDLVRIPGNIPCVNEGFEDMETEDFRTFLAVESLNVSVAAGVLLHHLIGKRHINDQIEDRVSDVLE